MNHKNNLIINVLQSHKIVMLLIENDHCVRGKSVKAYMCNYHCMGVYYHQRQATSHWLSPN